MTRVIFGGSTVARRLEPQSITTACNLLFLSRDVEDKCTCQNVQRFYHVCIISYEKGGLQPHLVAL